MVKKIKITAIAIVVLISLSIFFYPKIANKKENLSSELSVENIVDSSWQKNNSEHIFWFPKDGIVVIKKNNDFYQKIKASVETTSLTNYSEKSPEINEISQKIISHGYVLDKNTSGIFGLSSTSPYKLMSFKKGNNWCQIEHQFEIAQPDSKDFIDDGYSIACFNLDLEQEFLKQKQFYDLAIDKRSNSDYSIAVFDVQKNDKGYTKILSYAKSDGSVTIFDKNNKNICEGKPCCDESSKNDPILWNNNWCQNYKSIY